MVILNHTNIISLRNRFGTLIDYFLGKLYNLSKCENNFQSISIKKLTPVIHFKFLDVEFLVEKCRYKTELPLIYIREDIASKIILIKNSMRFILIIF